MSGESTNMTLGIIIAEDNVIWSLKVGCLAHLCFMFPWLKPKKKAQILLMLGNFLKPYVEQGTPSCSTLRSTVDL